MRTEGMDRLRGAMSALSGNGEHIVSNTMIYEAFGLGPGHEPEKARIRRRVNEMVKRKELTRVRPGVYEFNPRALLCQGEEYVRVWRAIRAEAPGWTYQDLTQVTRVSYTFVQRYCAWLEGEKYIARHGRKGNTQFWRATRSAHEQRNTPYPPRQIKDPFEQEKSAAAKLFRAMMERDPYQPAVRKIIVDACQILQGRFAPDENKTAMEEASC